MGPVHDPDGSWDDPVEQIAHGEQDDHRDHDCPHDHAVQTQNMDDKQGLIPQPPHKHGAGGDTQLQAHPVPAAQAGTGEHAEYVAHQWDAEVGEQPKIPLRRDRHFKPVTYDDAQRRIQQLDQRIDWAEHPANQEQVVTALDDARQRRQAQAAKKQSTRTSRLDPYSLSSQAAVRPSSTPDPDRGFDLGR